MLEYSYSQNSNRCCVPTFGWTVTKLISRQYFSFRMVLESEETSQEAKVSSPQIILEMGIKSRKR